MDTDEFLAHYGVKGMKWGYTKYSKDDIKTSRKTTRASAKQIGAEAKQVKAAIKAGDAATAKKILKKQIADTKKHNMSEELRASYQMTTGEQFAQAIFAGGMSYSKMMHDISRSDRDWDKYVESSNKIAAKYETKQLKKIAKVEAK